MKKRKRILALIVAVFLVLAAFPVTAGNVYAGEDDAPPAINVETLSVTLPTGVTSVTSGDKITVSVEITDESEVKEAKISFYQTDANVNMIINLEKKEGDLWEGTYEITNQNASGIWQLALIHAVDANENSVSLYNNRYELNGEYPFSDPDEYEDSADLSAMNFLVTDTDPDTSAPVIDPDTLTSTLPAGQSDVIPGEEVKVSVKATDASAVDSVKLYFYQVDSEQGFYLDLEGTEDDIWEGTCEVTEDMPKGKWQIQSIISYDIYTNGIYILNNQYTEKDGSKPFADTETYKNTMDFSAGDYVVGDYFTVTFDSRGGSDVAPQYVRSGGKAVKPENPTRESYDFYGWFQEDELKHSYGFGSEVTGDLTIYAGWSTWMALGVFNASNPSHALCGTVDVETADPDYSHMDTTTMNFTVLEGDVKFTAKPAEGFSFEGWYAGEFGESFFVEKPTGEMLSKETVYITDVPETAVCAVFLCKNHLWIEQTEKKATFDSDGNGKMVCKYCGIDGDTYMYPKVDTVKLAATSYTYTGKAIKPAVTMTIGETVIAPDFYTVTYSNNIKAGTATAKITLKNECYTGTKSLTFKINPKSIAKATVTGIIAKTYKGVALRQNPTVKVGTVTLKAGTDYTLTYKNNINAGKATVIITGKGNYTGKITKYFTIKKAANTLSLKGQTASVYYSALSKKSQTLALSKTVKVVNKGQGARTFKLLSATKSKKSFLTYFTINKTTGAIIVKKGLAKGTYAVKIQVKAAGNANYKASALKTVTVYIKVQ